MGCLWSYTGIKNLGNTNEILINSKKKKEWLDYCLGHVPKLGLSAEHGCFIKDPESSMWLDMTGDLDLSWKDGVKEIFEYYAERTPGSLIEDKKCSIA